MTENEIAWVARALARARRTGTAVDNALLAGVLSDSDGYAIQASVAAELGARIGGWKVALPPDGSVISAPVFDELIAGDGVVLAREAHLRQGIECELAFRLARPLPKQPPTGYEAEHVLPALGEAMAAFELLQCRLTAAFQSARPQLLADNLGNGGVVLGRPLTFSQEVDLTDIAVVLAAGDSELLSKRGGNPVGNPLRAVVALAEHLANRGLSLEPGQIVMTGSYTGVHLPRPGETVRAAFAGFSPVSIQICAEEGVPNVGR